MNSHANAVNWLLEPSDLCVRYLTLRDLVSADPKEVDAARAKAHREGEIAQVLAKMEPDGYWVVRGGGYLPKYTATVWSIILLSQLGAHVEQDERIARSCSYYLDQALNEGGQISFKGSPGGTVDCLQGNMCAAFLDLGYEDARLAGAFKWMARTVTGEGIAPMTDKKAPLRYYAGKCGPDFACGANNKLPCAWGGVKVMLALGKLPKDKRSPEIERAIKAGVDFLFSRDPADADYPSGYASKPSGNWWKFGFPVFYVTDLLQNVESLAALGYANDPRLARALQRIVEKQDAQGRWSLEYDYIGKTWADFGTRKQPNKWVTLRALRVFKAAGLLNQTSKPQADGLP